MKFWWTLSRSLLLLLGRIANSFMYFKKILIDNYDNISLCKNKCNISMPTPDLTNDLTQPSVLLPFKLHVSWSSTRWVRTFRTCSLHVYIMKKREKKYPYPFGTCTQRLCVNKIVRIPEHRGEVLEIMFRSGPKHKYWYKKTVKPTFFFGNDMQSFALSTRF